MLGALLGGALNPEYKVSFSKSAADLCLGGFQRGNPLNYDAASQMYNPRGGASQAQAVSAGESRVGRDTGGEAAQREALNRMREVSNQGYSNIDRAAMGSAQRNMLAGNRTAQESTQRNFQRRGMGGSGAELSGALIGGQGAADRFSQDVRDLNARGQERRIGATQSMNEIGNQLTGQQMGIGSAQDQMARYNAGNQQQTNLANAGFTNQAQGQEYQGSNQYLTNQADRQQQVGNMNTQFNQQMFGQFTRPFFGAMGGR